MKYTDSYYIYLLKQNHIYWAVFILHDLLTFNLKNIMKRIILTVAFFASITTYAQKFEVGAKAGVNVSNFTGTEKWQSIETNALVGYHFGGFISFFLGNKFAISPELLYSSQGAKFVSAGVTTSQKVSYINIPVLLKYRSTGGFYLEAGPQIGFNTGESSKNLDSLAKSTDLSVAAGIGFHSKMGLGIGARYTAGLSKVGDFAANNSINPDYKNGVFQLSLFYTLFNKRK